MPALCHLRVNVRPGLDSYVCKRLAFVNDMFVFVCEYVQIIQTFYYSHTIIIYLFIFTIVIIISNFISYTEFQLIINYYLFIYLFTFTK